jgi:hypothetical protein
MTLHVTPVRRRLALRMDEVIGPVAWARVRGAFGDRVLADEPFLSRPSSTLLADPDMFAPPRPQRLDAHPLLRSGAAIWEERDALRP